MDLSAWARERGYGIAWGPPDLISEVKGEMEGRREAGEVDPGLSQHYLHFSYTAPGVDAIEQVGVVASPVPAHTIRFESHSDAVTVLVPPTYVGEDSFTAAVIDDLACVLGRDGIRAGVLSIPRKLLATRLGLANYGRNNIAYVPGMGSYVMLSPFATDQALEPRSLGDRLPEPASSAGAALDFASVAPHHGSMAIDCSSCFACRAACPTQAIREDRFLLHAERCLVYANESVDPWPDWVPPSVHHCLVGCMRCQEACPQNAGRLRVEALPLVFAAEETEVALRGEWAGGDGQIWAAIDKKLAQAGLILSRPLLARNLRALVPPESRADDLHGRG